MGIWTDISDLVTGPAGGDLVGTYPNPTVPTAPIQRKPRWWLDPAQATIVTEFQSGHGFTTSGADASSNVNDTTSGLPIFGTQCATVVTAGTGASAILLGTGLTAADTTNSQIGILFRIDDTTHLNSASFSMSNDSGFTNEYHVQFTNTSSLASGQWLVFTIAPGDFQTQGSPTRTGITALRLYVKDDNTGNKVTVHWGGIFLMPNGSAQIGAPYPNGVCSICFDDNYSTQWDQAKPLLDTYGYRASIFPIVDMTGTTNRMTLAQIQSLQDDCGWEINGHAYTDADHATTLPSLSAAALLADIQNDKLWLRANGLDGQGTAYPSGKSVVAGGTGTVVPTVRQFFRWSRNTVNKTETYPPGDLYQLKAYSGISTFSGGTSPSSIYTSTTGFIDQAVTNKSWIVLTFHRIIPTVTSVVMSSNTATITFSGNHTLSAGASITMAGFTPSGLNGNFTIATVPTATTMTVNIGSNPGNSTIQGTVLSGTTDIGYADFQTIIAKIQSSGIAVMPVGDVIDGRNLPQTSYATVGSSSPVSDSGTAPTAGTSALATRIDHAHPRRYWEPVDHGIKAWTFDPVISVNTTTMATAGTMYTSRIHVPVADSITNIILYLSTLGSLLTTGQCFISLYQNGSLIGTTADQTAVWNTGGSTGLKTAALSGGPFAVVAGDVIVAMWFNGTTGPAFQRAAGNSNINVGLSADNSRFGTANTSITTTPPGTLGTISAASISWWVALS